MKLNPAGCPGLVSKAPIQSQPLSRWLAAGAALSLWLTGPAVSPLSAQLKLAASATTDGKVQLHLQGKPNGVYVIQATTDLTNWVSLSTNTTTVTGLLTVTDGQSTEFKQRFYRGLILSQPKLIRLSTRIMVKPKAGADLSGLEATLGVRVVNSFSGIGNLQVLELPAGANAQVVIDALVQSGLAAYAEPDVVMQAYATPNDYYYSDADTLWGLQNSGLYGGKVAADIDAADAWDIRNSASNIIAAVVDTGINYRHEDLAANMWTRASDGSHGLNLVANGKAVNDPDDDHGHGTIVAGIIGAVGDNNIGTVGVAWHVKLMACKFLDSTGNGTLSDAIACMDYARTNGASVINASWGSNSFNSQAFHDAIASLNQAGIIVVAAAGNSAVDNDVSPIFPAGFTDLPNVIPVAATTRNDTLASWSDFGATNVYLGAPGDDIFSCGIGSTTNYQAGSGTSMAAAIVSGACVILKAHFTNDTPAQTVHRILANVDPLPALAGKCTSGGRLNLYKALSGGVAPPKPVANFSASVVRGGTPLSVQFSNNTTGNVAALNWDFGDGSPQSGDSNPSHIYFTVGSFPVTLTATGDAGSSSATQIITVTNAPPPTIELAIIPAASTNSGVSGVFKLSRTGSTAFPLTVRFTLGGSAVSGVDYESLPTTAVIPIGVFATDVVVTRAPKFSSRTPVSVKLVLTSDASYTVGANKVAVVSITTTAVSPDSENDVR